MLDTVFSCGQLYVTLSRGTNWNRIKMLLPDDANEKTVNVVCSEVISNP